MMLYVLSINLPCTLRLGQQSTEETFVQQVGSSPVLYMLQSDVSVRPLLHMPMTRSPYAGSRPELLGRLTRFTHLGLLLSPARKVNYFTNCSHDFQIWHDLSKRATLFHSRSARFDVDTTALGKN